jgi:hypothetical protein
MYFPGAVYEGGGTRQLILDHSMTHEQRGAIDALERAEHAGTYFEIFASVCPHRLPTRTATIELEHDREARRAEVRIGDLVDARIKPIRSPATGKPHRARIVLPEGFEFKEAEIADTIQARVSSVPPLKFTLEHSFAQLNAFDWTNV